MDELVAEVATASKERSLGIGQVNITVGQMDKIIQNNAATAEESTAASEELTNQAEAMRRSVAELMKLAGEQVKDLPAQEIRENKMQRPPPDTFQEPQRLSPRQPFQTTTSTSFERFPRKLQCLLRLPNGS